MKFAAKFFSRSRKIKVKFVLLMSVSLAMFFFGTNFVEARLNNDDEARLNNDDEVRLNNNDVARLNNDEVRLNNDEVRLNNDDVARLNNNDEVRLNNDDEVRLNNDDVARLNNDDEARLNNDDEVRLNNDDEVRLDDDIDDFLKFIGFDYKDVDDFLNLSSADLASDFDYYLDFMEKNSPVFAVALRLHPNLREEAKKCRKKILKSKSNFEQINLINNFVVDHFNGHSGMYEGDLNDFVNMFGCGCDADKVIGLNKNWRLYDDSISYEDLPGFSKIDFDGMDDKDREVEALFRLTLNMILASQAKHDVKKILADPQIFENTRKCTEYYKNKYQSLLKWAESHIGREFTNEIRREHENLEEGYVPETEFRVLKPGKIAYMRIPSFDENAVTESEKQKYMDFYKKISNYENLIIDLRNNAGGMVGYISYLLPIFKKSFDVKNIGLYRLGPYFEKWKTELENPFRALLDADEDTNLESFKSVSELPSMPALDASDVECATHFLDVGHKYGFDRGGPTDLDFHGKVYLLINGGTGSAATLFTQMAISSKEVTVVGQPTAPVSFGGWNVFVLPKSKLVFAYETCNTLNEDGSSQLEFGVKPHVFYDGNPEEMLDWLIDKIESPGGFDAHGDGYGVELFENDKKKDKKTEEKAENFYY